VPAASCGVPGRGRAVMSIDWRMPPRVAVFGAGITGLTAAHELIERGFRVRVYEEAAPGPDEEICGIGGMARTQYASVPVSNEEYARGAQPWMDSDTAFMQARPVAAGRAAFLSQRLQFAKGRCDLDAAKMRFLD